MPALKGISLAIAPGEFVAIMGPSGSGKSTAMNSLGCLDTPSAGHYLFKGAHVEALSRDQRARLRRRYLGFVFQGFNLLARTSALENVALPLLYCGDAAAARRAAALQALASVGLAGWEQHSPAQLSGGQQQRVVIARAIVTAPAVVLADAPTGNLDTQRSHEIMGPLLALNRDQGITMLMVTHAPDIAAYARRKLIFVDGRVADDAVNPHPPTEAPAVSLLVGGIGIMNIMLVSVTERTREIGLRLAVGALEAEVLLQLLVGAVVLSALGGIIGILIATAASYVLSGVMAVPCAFDLSIKLLALLFSAFIGVVFGYFPARRAARMDLIEALRHE